MELGEPQRALDDLDVVIQLNPQPVAFWSRGEVYRLIGEYEKALEDFDRAEQIDPAQWTEDAFGLLVQADCHARLGNEAAALACCARLHDDFCRFRWHSHQPIGIGQDAKVIGHVLKAPFLAITFDTLVDHIQACHGRLLCHLRPSQENRRQSAPYRDSTIV